MKNKELEIKFALRDPNQGHAVFSDEWVGALLVPGSRKTLPMRAVYYDTPGRHLSALRAGYRIRQEGDDLVSTFKWSSGEGSGGFSRRLEYNIPVEKEVPDLAPFAPLLREEGFPEAAQLAQSLADCPALRPLFVSDCVRTLADVRFRDALLEISVDTGELSAGGHREAVCELECELKEGTEEDLKAFGGELSRRFGLKPLNDSKLKRGLALAEEIGDER